MNKRFSSPTRRVLPLLLIVLAAPLSALAQNAPVRQTYSSSSEAGVDSGAGLGGAETSTRPAPRIAHPYLGPSSVFSRIALGVDVSPLGIGVEAATNINPHLNVRANGSLFQYTADNISTEGFNVTAKIKMSSARASLDYYPFHAGFRLSPGIMFYNGNHASVVFAAASGTSFSLDDHTYYSATGANAVVGHGAFGLGNGRPAFTMTTGWGNVIPRSGRHFSFPFEVGVAFIKDPAVALNLTGFVCDSNGQNCVDVATDPTAQADLASQVKSYQNDVDPLKTYPIVSFGVAYNFKTRSR